MHQNRTAQGDPRNPHATTHSPLRGRGVALLQSVERCIFIQKSAQSLL